MEHQSVISLGSNIVGREESVMVALTALREICSDGVDSGVYLTRPVSGVGDDYANAVFCGCYYGDPQELTARLKQMEVMAGRDEAARERGEVPIDLDLVMVDGVVVRPKDFARDYFIRGYDIIRYKITT